MTSKTNPICRNCGVELTGENWYSSCQKKCDYICNTCHNNSGQQWKKANPEKAKVIWTRGNRERGMRPFNENKKCTLYLGVHIAEQVLSQAFKHVKIKSACKRKPWNGWLFNINHNKIADYFLCLAFDNRENLNPLYAWLIPGGKVNHLKNASISQSTIHKWDAYKLDISKINECCDAMRTEPEVL